MIFMTDPPVCERELSRPIEVGNLALAVFVFGTSFSETVLLRKSFNRE